MPELSGPRLSIGVLGPLEVRLDGEPLGPLSSRLRSVVAALAMSAGTTVSTERLAAIVWDERLPDNARRTLQTYVSRLRTYIGVEDRLVTAPSGVRLEVDAEDVDALRFERLLDRASRAADDDEEQALLAEAIGLWRGTPFADVESRWLEETEAPQLTERYLASLEHRIDFDIAAGRTDHLVGELRRLASSHPLREPLWARLLRTLQLNGRQAEALDSYEAIRVRLAEELGTDPGPELQRLHRELLAGQSPEPGELRSRIAAAPVTVPRQLPIDVDRFSGRAPEMKELADLLNPETARRSKVAVVSGMAGVGKTTLAVHFAHESVQWFPDGQLYIDLAGFGPRPPIPADEALRRFIETLAPASGPVPDDTETRAGLYRSVTAGKRLLLVLDNASDADQVAALLPGGSGCFTLVTSRNRLDGLLARTGAHRIALEPVTHIEARQMVIDRLGPDRVASDADALDPIVRRCAGLPLALAVVSARAASTADLRLPKLAADLEAESGSLDGLDLDGDALDIRSVFSWSYSALEDEAARVFRLLATLPGAECTVEAAASLAEVPPRRVRSVLAKLIRANLVSERPGDRFGLHDLLCAYAVETAADRTAGHDRTAALSRLCEHYLRSAYNGDVLLDPQRDRIALPEPPQSITPFPMPDRDAAMDWFAREHRSLVRLVQEASASGLHRQAWRIAWAMISYLDLSNRWRDWEQVQRLAAQAAALEGTRSELALSRRLLGRALTRLARYADAAEQFLSALDHYAVEPDPVGEAITHVNLGWLYEQQGDFRSALGHNRSALKGFESVDHLVGQSRAYNAIGWDLAQLGELEEARELCERSLEFQVRIDDRRGQAETLDSLGYVHRRLGELARAIGYQDRACTGFADLGDRYNEADSYVVLGEMHLESGDSGRARDCYEHALSILTELEHPEAAAVAERVERLAGSLRARAHAARRPPASGRLRATTRGRPSVLPWSRVKRRTQSAQNSRHCGSAAWAPSSCQRIQCFQPSGRRSACSTSKKPERPRCALHQSGLWNAWKSHFQASARCSGTSPPSSSARPSGTIARTPPGARNRWM
ncbi:DNA-binding transcriptional activator of the SARP family [Glycomyces harbinensis]|uniref:DNA-binding transcriptional activator of the SARP family n=1 Tax=Glycomyces harbinensis TaxID=58114 RepID=A0A1G6WUU6_9ACTN|nr:DNA-binding transcriptional activator of the SARP family [Glycomyces harbinensis]